MPVTSPINEIPIQTSEGRKFDFATGNDVPILHEIRHALRRLLSEGKPTVIDLQAIPMAPGEEQRIMELLGVGEVKAEVNALGPSEIVETAYPGVWSIVHRNARGDTVGKFIEITRCPDILRSQEADIKASSERIDRILSELHAACSGGST